MKIRVLTGFIVFTIFFITNTYSANYDDDVANTFQCKGSELKLKISTGLIKRPSGSNCDDYWLHTVEASHSGNIVKIITITDKSSSSTYACTSLYDKAGLMREKMKTNLSMIYLAIAKDKTIVFETNANDHLISTSLLPDE